MAVDSFRVLRPLTAPVSARLREGRRATDIKMLRTYLLRANLHLLFGRRFPPLCPPCFSTRRIYPDGLLQKWNARVPQLEVRPQAMLAFTSANICMYRSFMASDESRTELWQSMTRPTLRLGRARGVTVWVDILVCLPATGF